MIIIYLFFVLLFLSVCLSVCSVFGDVDEENFLLNADRFIFLRLINNREEAKGASIGMAAWISKK